MKKRSTYFPEIVDQIEESTAESCETGDVAFDPATGNLAAIDSLIPRKTGKRQLRPDGVSPQVIIQDTIKAVRDSDLQAFLACVLSEPEVEQVLTTVVRGQGYYQRYAIQYLHRAAGMANFWCVQERREREVVYVATLVEGLKQLMAPWIVGDANADDVVFTIVRSALHRLDDNAPLVASQLRLSLGWGNADEFDNSYIPRVHQIIRRALQRAGLTDEEAQALNRRLPN